MPTLLTGCIKCRTRLSLATSRDGGATWQRQVLLESEVGTAACKPNPVVTHGSKAPGLVSSLEQPMKCEEHGFKVCFFKWVSSYRRYAPVGSLLRFHYPYRLKASGFNP